MNTEKSPSEKVFVSEDIKKMQENLDNMFSSISEKRQLVLESHENSFSEINSSQKDFLYSIGFGETKNIKEFEEKEKFLNDAGVKMSVIDFLKKVKKTYNKDIISYNNLCDLCEKYNLYFGSSKLFIKEIPIENIREMQDFPFKEFNSHYPVITSVDGVSVVEGPFAFSPITMIVAPITSFTLKNVIISNSRELIPFNGVDSKYKSPCGEDPIVLLPFRNPETREVFFLILTHWENSNSLI